MTIRVLKPGLLTTVQDLGRLGYQQYGVPTGGAMDTLSLRQANLAVGNDEHAAALEMTLLGPALQFEHDSLIAMAGADLQPCIEGTSLPQARPVFVKANSVLTMSGSAHGAFAYLAVAGGIDVPKVMGSLATFLRASIGGFQGRALQSGDRLPIGSLSNRSQALMQSLCGNVSVKPWHSVPWCVANQASSEVIRVVEGSELAWLSTESAARLFTETFTVTPQSDRMGYRLRGPELQLAHAAELISEAVCPGTIQLPPGGDPILLMADCAPTGGYAKVAHVIAADLHLAAQKRPGETIRFARVSLDEARRLWQSQERDMMMLRTALAMQLPN